MKKKLITAWIKVTLLFCILIIALLPSACIKHTPRLAKEGKILEANVSEKSLSSLAFEVVEFKWEYNSDKKDFIEITGTVRNNSGRPQQAVSFLGEAFDETGQHLFISKSFLDPTYIPDGAEASFEFKGLVKPGMANIKFIRLVTTATTLD